MAVVEIQMMGTTELLAYVFFTMFTANAALVRSAGLDSVDAVTRGTKSVLPMSVGIAFSSAVTNVIVYAILKLSGSTTLLDATVTVLSALFVSYASDFVYRKLGGKDKSEHKWLMFNSATCGVVLLARAHTTVFLDSLICTVIFSVSVAVTYAVIAHIRTDMRERDIPRAFRGAPSFLLLLGLCAMALLGFEGVEF